MNKRQNKKHNSFVPSVSNGNTEQAKAIFKMAYFDSLNRQEHLTYEKRNTEELETISQRNQAISVSRNLYRNDPFVSSMVNLKAECVIGFQGGKCQFNSDNQDWNFEAQRNIKGFTKDCLYNEPNKHINEVLKSIYISAMVDGDILVYQSNKTQGKLLLFEADQLVQIEDATFKNKAIENGYYDELDELDYAKNPIKKIFTQKQGCVLDRFGVVRFYVVTSDPNASSFNFDNTLILNAKDCTLFANKTRSNQLRGVPTVLSVADLADDLGQIVRSEAQTARKLARMGLAVTVKDKGLPVKASIASQGLDDSDLTPENKAKLQQAARQGSNLVENLKRNVGAEVYIMEDGEAIKPFEFNRPNVNIEPFVTWLKRAIGAKFGLSSVLSLQLADKSYSASRTELTISYLHFYSEQKRLERSILDITIPKFLEINIFFKKISKPTDEDYSDKISYFWPKQPQIKPLEDAQTLEKELNIGATDYSIIDGADWKRIADKKAEVREYYKSKGLGDLVQRETKSGQVVENTDNEDSEDNTDYTGGSVGNISGE